MKVMYGENKMSSFKTHRRFNYLIFIIGCLILNHFNLFNVYIMTTIGIGFIIGTELVTPDLDTASTPSSRVGWVYMLLNVCIIFARVASGRNILFYLILSSGGVISGRIRVMCIFPEIVSHIAS